MSEAPHRPLSQRLGLREPFKLRDGVPSHLDGVLWVWVNGRLQEGLLTRSESSLALSYQIITKLEIPFYIDDDIEPAEAVIAHGMESSTNLLDIVDYLVTSESADQLEEILAGAHSMYTVEADEEARGFRRLALRVTPEAHATYDRATSERDEISADLSEAWRCAFGRDENPGRSWSRSLRAVEGALHQIVLPGRERAQFGNIIKALRKSPRDWVFVISDGDQAGDGSSIVPVLELIGYEPGRHPGSEVKPSLEQARAIAVLAATVVEWVRQGAFRRAEG